MQKQYLTHMKIGIFGSGAREAAIAKAMEKSKHKPSLYCYGSSNNPSIASIAAEPICIGDLTDVKKITEFAKKHKIDFAVIGPEAPLEAGVVDALFQEGIQCIGPFKGLAEIETSKSFAMDLVASAGIDGCPKYCVFSSMKGVGEYIKNVLGIENCVFKPDGLTGGKGVMVYGDHFQTLEEVLGYAQKLVEQGQKFVIEEKLEGEEGSLMAFCDKNGHIVFMPWVQDNKRRYPEDKGPNTGGMGSYSMKNHLLPFLTKEDDEKTRNIMRQTIEALNNQSSEHFIGILYGGFMKTKDGIKLIEYNARFGDPEALNVLALLDHSESDLVTIFKAMIDGELNKIPVKFRNEASLALYGVDHEYPEKGEPHLFDASAVNPEKLYYSSVRTEKDGLYTTGSRTCLIVDTGPAIKEVYEQVISEMRKIIGLEYREDIASEPYFERKKQRMLEIMERFRNRETNSEIKIR